MKKVREAKASGKPVDYEGIFSKLTKTYGCFDESKYIIDARPTEAHKEGEGESTVERFSGESRRKTGIEAALRKHGIRDLDEAAEICEKNSLDIRSIVSRAQSDAFDDAMWAYTLGSAIAIKAKAKSAAEAARLIGEGLQAFCIPGSVAANRRVGEGHGNLGEMLLSEETKCFAFLAGHESFAAASGAIKLAKHANKARKTPLKVILNGLGKDAAYIIARINGFTYVETEYDQGTQELHIVKEIPFSKDPEKTAVRCYGADDVNEGCAIMKYEQVDVSITGNSTNPTRFQHPVAGTYKKWCVNNGKRYFSVASGGGTGRTLHPDNMKAGPASYGLTDTMGRMHSDAQFAGSSSVAAHVEMMGYIGMGNNPMVGVTVECAVGVANAVNGK
ncbi:MAG: GGGtGRT protein [Clostridia bacterium]|nr:GGGtGRT protein [Clostridia bacterium]